MVDHKRIYQQEGDRYQLLVAREDFQENLLPAILSICSFDDLDVVDLGSGTGRVASLLGPKARRVYAFDRSHHMLKVAASLTDEQIGCDRLAAAAEHRAIPLPRDSADMIISGWSFCYLAVWEEKDWGAALLEGLREIKRVLRNGGPTIIIETLGTGVEEPQPPDKLEPYFYFLEDLGFSRTWIRTDYRFNNREEALELTKFFFGREMLNHITDDEEPILPECTGLWWCRDINL